MNQGPFGETRTHIQPNHALIAADGHVVSPMVGWDNAEGVVLISPVLGAAPSAPRFVQYLVHGSQECSTTGAAAGVQRLVYVLQGDMKINGAVCKIDSFAWFPPGDEYLLEVTENSRLLVFEKNYEPLSDQALPPRIVGNLADAPRDAFLGDPDAQLSTLLPVEAAFDMAVNVFEYQPGATLPFVETHIMEHGLYMRSGQGVYRLDDNYYPVKAGDTIWMASYCPQWFVAMGKEPASYIYYKDIHRNPLISV